MRKWRPTHKCIYVIPEVHGALESLKIIFSRILPLRFSINQEDTLILLGDYIDKGNDSAGVIDLLIDAKKEYKDKLICLCGNHERLMLDALKDPEVYQSWLNQGGSTTMQSYINRNSFATQSNYIPFSRLTDIIPRYHIDFLNSLPSHIEFEDYVLFHGGFNIADPSSTGDGTFIFDTGTSASIKRLVRAGKQPLKTLNKVYVGSHNHKDKKPWIYSKYLMLGGSAPQNLILFELNSMTCAMIKHNKSRIYKHNFKYFE